MKTVVITGASGNLGGKLRQHWKDRYQLRLLDRSTNGDNEIETADVGCWNSSWVDRFVGADAVIHLAADGIGCADRHRLIRTNIYGTMNVFKAAVDAGVRRVIFASSSHVMGMYRFIAEPATITTDLETYAGGHFVQDGWSYDSTVYATTKVFGEKLARRYSEEHALEVIVVRIGFIMQGKNAAEDFPARTDEWLKQLWMSNSDFYALMDRCLQQEFEPKFAIAHGISRNAGSCWDVESTEKLLAFEAQDGLVVNPAKVRLRPGYLAKLRWEFRKLIPAM